jgi:hypothetical protein
MSRKLAVMALILAPIALSSCSDSDSGGSGPDTTPPHVSQVSIADGATGVGLVEQLRVTFSEPMDPATITGTSLVVAGRSATGYIDYDETTRTASFTPDTLYAVSTPHQLIVTEDVTDAEGNALASEHSTAFTTGPIDCEHLLDHLEPNDDIAGATVIGLNEWVHTLTQCEGRTDRDYFQFTLDETAKIHARALFKHCIEDQSWVTEFRRSDDELYVNAGNSGNPGETKGWYYTFLPGTYWVSVYSSESEPWDFVLYDFMLETDEPCRDDAFEDNDFIEEAVQTQANEDYDLVGCMVDADYFWVDITQGQTLTVTVTTSGAYTNRRLKLYDTSQSQVAYYNGSDNPASVSYTATGSGTHYIMTRFWDDGAEYEMNISVE